MLKIDKFSSDNDYHGGQAELVLSSFFHQTGKKLIDPYLSGIELYQALFEAPFAVLSHDIQADPIFNYGNKTALELFDMEWTDFIKLPSRLSAEQGTQEERDRLLARVTQYGYIDDYKGVRISSTGKRFLVEDAIVWNMVDEGSVYRGQAAVLYKWSKL